LRIAIQRNLLQWRESQRFFPNSCTIGTAPESAVPMVGTPFKLAIQDLRDIAEIGQHCGDGGALGFAQCAVDAHPIDSHPDRVVIAQEATGAREKSVG
jgi:hypothetical protein